MSVRKRIVILGCPGSGKSTFAKDLHRRTGLPLYHLDNIWWNADRTHITRDAFDERLSAILKEEAWILDGDYSRTYEMRIAACDTVIFLDYDEKTCMTGIESRTGTERTDMPWTEQTLDPELADTVKRYRTENRPSVYTLLEQYADKERRIFVTREEAGAWLDTLQ